MGEQNKVHYSRYLLLNVSIFIIIGIILAFFTVSGYLSGSACEGTYFSSPDRPFSSPSVNISQESCNSSWDMATGISKEEIDGACHKMEKCMNKFTIIRIPILLLIFTILSFAIVAVFFIIAREEKMRAEWERLS